MSKNLSAKYYQENKKRLQKKRARGRYQNLSREGKQEKQKYDRECYKNLLSTEKKYFKMRKNALS